jgi:hypothetical protein
LEADGVLLACNGCRRDVYPSPMLRQSAGGRRAYVLTMPRSEVKPPTVDIFEPAPDVSVVVTVDEQRAWFDHWRPNNPGKDGGSEAVDPSAALIAAARTKPGGWVYEVVGEFGPDDAVPPTSIRGAWKVDDDGEIVGDFLPNPVFEPDGTNGRDC